MLTTDPAKNHRLNKEMEQSHFVANDEHNQYSFHYIEKNETQKTQFLTVPLIKVKREDIDRVDILIERVGELSLEGRECIDKHKSQDETMSWQDYLRKYCPSEI